MLEQIDSQLGQISSLISIPIDQVAMVMCMVLSIPLGGLFRLIQSALLRKIIGLSLGLVMQYLVFREMTFQLIGHSLIIYILIGLSKQHSQKVIFIYSFIFLLGYHLHSVLYKYMSWNLDITTVMMMYTLKYTALAFNISDSYKQDTQLSPYQLKYKVTSLPSLLDYFSYIFFFQGCLAGPFYEYQDFMQFIYYNQKHKKMLPVSFSHMFYNLIMALIFMWSTTFVAPKYPLVFVSSLEYGQLSYFHKILYGNISVSLLRAKYYCGWLLVQTSIVCSGFAYDWDNNTFTKVLTADPKLELDHTFKNKMELWNASTQIWFYSESQIRANPAKANVSQYITFTVSALWHGFYIGYYFCFIQAAVLNQLAKYLFKAFTFYQSSFDKVYLFQNPLYILLRYAAVVHCLNYAGILFQLMDLQLILKYLKNMNYDVTILTLLLTVFFAVTQIGQKRVQSVKKDVKSL